MNRSMPHALAVFLLPAVLIGCNDKEPAPEPPPQSAPAAQPARGPVVLIEITERNGDSFAEPLLLSEYEEDEPAFAVVGGWESCWAWRCTLHIRTGRGSGAHARTPMGCCGSTFRKEWTFTT